MAITATLAGYMDRRAAAKRNREGRAGLIGFFVHVFGFPAASVGLLLVDDETAVRVGPGVALGGSAPGGLQPVQRGDPLCGIGVGSRGGGAPRLHLLSGRPGNAVLP